MTLDSYYYFYVLFYDTTSSQKVTYGRLYYILLCRFLELMLQRYDVENIFGLFLHIIATFYRYWRFHEFISNGYPLYSFFVYWNRINILKHIKRYIFLQQIKKKLLNCQTNKKSRKENDKSYTIENLRRASTMLLSLHDINKGFVYFSKFRLSMVPTFLYRSNISKLLFHYTYIRFVELSVWYKNKYI